MRGNGEHHYLSSQGVCRGMGWKMIQAKCQIKDDSLPILFFVFDREVLNNYSNLADVISERWQETLTKASEAFQPPLDLKASCRVKKYLIP